MIGEKIIDNDLSEWEKVRMGDVAWINMGQSPKSEFYNLEDIGLPFLQGNRTFGIKYPYFDTYCSQPKKIAEKGDILFSVRAPVGDINVAIEKCCIGRGLSAVSSQYKSYALYKMKSISREFDHFESTGTVFGSINKTSFENITVLIPADNTIEMYDAVASVIDKKIFNNFTQIQTLSKTRDTLLPKLMSGELRVAL